MAKVHAHGDGRLDRLERRVQALEDELAIARLVVSYGPAVDTLDAQGAAHLWSEDGIYDIGSDVWSGGDAIAGMVRGEQHGGLVAGGVAHVHTFPKVHVDGDRAVAVGYTRIYRRQPEGFMVWRVSANRWELERGPGGWRCTRRQTRLMDGSEEARTVLATLRS